MITTMSMAEVAVYLREIRRGRGFTQESLAEAVDVSKRTIERLERNEGDITVITFERVIAVLRASADQVNYLATHKTVTIDEARALALAWLERKPSSDEQRGDASRTGLRPMSTRVAQAVNELRHLEADEIIDVIDVLLDFLRKRRAER